MTLNAFDLHFVFSNRADHCSGWDAQHRMVFSAEMHDDAVGGTGTGHFAECPAGTFIVGAPVEKNAPPFGHWFTRLLELPDHHEFEEAHRAGIGIHGGGSASPDPMAPNQGFYKTEGCFRLLNCMNEIFVVLVKAAYAHGGTVYFTNIRD